MACSWFAGVGGRRLQSRGLFCSLPTTLVGVSPEELARLDCDSGLPTGSGICIMDPPLWLRLHRRDLFAVLGRQGGIPVGNAGAVCASVPYRRIRHFFTLNFGALIAIACLSFV